MSYLILAENQQVKLTLTNLPFSSGPSQLEFVIKYKQSFANLYTLYGSEAYGKKVYIIEINQDIKNISDLYKAIYYFKRSSAEGKGINTNGGFLFINSPIPLPAKLKLPLQLNCYYVSPTDEHVYQLTKGNYLAPLGREITQANLDQLVKAATTNVIPASAHAPSTLSLQTTQPLPVSVAAAITIPKPASAAITSFNNTATKRQYIEVGSGVIKAAHPQADKKQKMAIADSLKAKLPPLTFAQQQQAAAMKDKHEKEKAAELAEKKRRLDEFNQRAKTRVADQEQAIAQAAMNARSKEQQRSAKLKRRSKANLETSSVANTTDNTTLPPQVVSSVLTLHEASETRRIGTQNIRAFLATSRAYLNHLDNPSAAASSIMAITPKCIPRPYQIEVLEAFCNARDSDRLNRASLPIVMPTGTGKSCLISILTGYSNGKYLVLAPATEVVEGLQDEIKAFCPEPIRIANVDHFQASQAQKQQLLQFKKTFDSSPKTVHDHKIYHEGKTLVKKEIYNSIIDQNDIIVCSNQFLKANKKFKIFPWNRFVSVIFDEVHHLPAEGNVELFKYIRDEKHLETIGMTATPNPELYEIFGLNEAGSDNPIQSFNIQQAIDKKALTPIQFGLIVFDESGKFRLTHKGEFSASDVEAKLKQERFTKAIAHFVLNKNSPKTFKPFRHMTTLISCVGVDQAKQMKTTLNTAVSMTEFDPRMSLRNRYAANILKADLKTKAAILARAKKIKISDASEQAKAMTEELAKEIAMGTAGVATAIFAPRKGKDDPLTQEDIETDKRIYELGGYTFASVCGKLGEGYSLSRIEHVIPFRMSTSTMLISQLGGRAERLDKENPDKVAHITQVSTKDDIGKIALYHEEHLTINGKTQFSYGELPVSSREDCAMPDAPLPEIAISGFVSYRYNTEEPEELKTIKAIKQQAVERKAASEKRKNETAQRKQIRASTLYVSLTELKKMIHQLKLLFKSSKVEEVGIDKDESDILINLLSNEKAAVAEQSISNIGISTSAPPVFIAKMSNDKNQTTYEILTRRKHDFLINAKKTLSNISSILHPLYHAISKKSTWDNARKVKNPCHHDDLTAVPEATLMIELFKEAKSLIEMILHLRRNNYSYHGEFIESTLCKENTHHDVSDTDQLEQTIKELSDAIEQDTGRIAEAIIEIKRASKSNMLAKHVYNKKNTKRNATNKFISIGKKKLSTIDPENKLSIFEVSEFIKKENSDTTRYAENHIEIFKAKLLLSPNQLIAIDPNTGNNILHLFYLISETRFFHNGSRIKGSAKFAYNTLESILASCPVDLFTQKNLNDDTPVHLFTRKYTYLPLKFRFIKACFDRSVDPTHPHINMLKISLENKLASSFDFYKSCFFNQSWSIRDHQNNSILHFLYLLQGYIIDQILEDYKTLNFTIKNNENQLPIDNLIFKITYKGIDKQLRTLEKLLKLKLNLGIPYYKIYLHLIEYYLTDSQVIHFIMMGQSFNFPFYLSAANEADFVSVDNILIRVLSKFDELVLVADPKNLFTVLKNKSISQHVISTVQAKFETYCKNMFHQTSSMKNCISLLKNQILLNANVPLSLKPYQGMNNNKNDLEKTMECFRQFCLTFTGSEPHEYLLQYTEYLNLLDEHEKMHAEYQQFCTSKNNFTVAIPIGHINPHSIPQSDSDSMLEFPLTQPYDDTSTMSFMDYVNGATPSSSSLCHTLPVVLTSNQTALSDEDLDEESEEDEDNDSDSDSENMSDSVDAHTSEENEHIALSQSSLNKSQENDESDFSSSDDEENESHTYFSNAHLAASFRLFSNSLPAAANSNPLSKGGFHR